MDFLQKLDFLMEKYGLNKSSMSQNSGIPYTTIDGWYKKGYDGLKLSTFRKLAAYFNTTLDFWILDDISDPNYGKTFGFEVKSSEMEHIQKYRILDQHGKEAVDSILDIEHRHFLEELKRKQEEHKTEESAEPDAESILYYFPMYDTPMSAGTGQAAGQGYPENVRLVKEPPRGASYIAPVCGNSMEPTYHNGDLLFIRATPEVEPGQIGVFLMDGQQWVKELGDDVLISHNKGYGPIPFTEGIQCQGLVLGICDDSYFE